jgi:hypothetical protein
MTSVTSSSTVVTSATSEGYYGPPDAEPTDERTGKRSEKNLREKGGMMRMWFM